MSLKYEFDDDEEPESAPQNSITITPALNLNLLGETLALGSKCLDDCLDSEVIFVLGKTGTGKSSFIQFLAGKNLERTIYRTKESKSEKIIEIEVFDVVGGDPLEGFEIGHEKTSQTRNIRSYEQEIVNPKSGASSEVLFLDFPGFEDTISIETDIAISIWLTEVSRKCKSARFVVLINCVTLLEDRGNAMRHISSMISNIVDDFNKFRQNFYFLFTHTEKLD